MEKFKVVCLDTDHPDYKHVEDALAPYDDIEIVECFTDPHDEAAAIKAVRDADAILWQWATLNSNVLAAAPKCKVVSFFGLGLDRVDIPYCTEHGIMVCNNQYYNKHEVANHAFAMICALSRQLFTFDRSIRKGVYGLKCLDVELHRPELQTVGLFSFGRISRKIAYKCKEALGMNVIFYDPFLPDDAGAELGAKKVDFDTLLKESDYISVNGPATPENFHMFNKDAFEKMKPTAYLVNCARGQLVNTEDLVNALQHKTIAGAALDVFEYEPITPDDPLTKLDNVILTPHSAWHTRESMYDQGYYAAFQAAQALHGEVPQFCVNAKELGLK